MFRKYFIDLGLVRLIKEMINFVETEAIANKLRNRLEAVEHEEQRMQRFLDHPFQNMLKDAIKLYNNDNERKPKGIYAMQDTKKTYFSVEYKVSLIYNNTTIAKAVSTTGYEWCYRKVYESVVLYGFDGLIRLKDEFHKVLNGRKDFDTWINATGNMVKRDDPSFHLEYYRSQILHNVMRDKDGFRLKHMYDLRVYPYASFALIREDYNPHRPGCCCVMPLDIPVGGPSCDCTGVQGVVYYEALKNMITYEKERVKPRMINPRMDMPMDLLDVKTMDQIRKSL